MNEGLLRIILAGRDFLVKMLITLVPNGIQCILIKVCILTQVCKTVTSIHLEQCPYLLVNQREAYKTGLGSISVKLSCW